MNGALGNLETLGELAASEPAMRLQKKKRREEAV
jgi:hypothetical protein